ncbi:hypothetical protein [Streptomyces asiaticus]
MIGRLIDVLFAFPALLVAILAVAVFGKGMTAPVRRLLPNIGPTVLAQSTVIFGYALLDLAALSFLGLCVQPPTPD